MSDDALLGFARTVHAVVLEELGPYGPESADVTLGWDDRGGVWLTDVRPRHPRAARLTVAVERAGEFAVTVGETWQEIFELEDPVRWLRRLCVAVFAGKVLETGPKAASRCRFTDDDGDVAFGAVGVLPAALWRTRRYDPYSARAAGTSRP